MRRITRRTAAKLLLSGPAALALPRLVEGAEKPARPAKAPLSPAERRQYEKSVAQLRGVAEKIRAMEIPMGTEPAFVFRPLLPTE